MPDLQDAMAASRALAAAIVTQVGPGGEAVVRRRSAPHTPLFTTTGQATGATVAPLQGCCQIHPL